MVRLRLPRLRYPRYTLLILVLGLTFEAPLFVILKSVLECNVLDDCDLTDVITHRTSSSSNVPSNKPSASRTPHTSPVASKPPPSSSLQPPPQPPQPHPDDKATSTQSEPRKNSSSSKDISATHVILVFVWPPALEADTWEEVDYSRFYFHGLWPTYATGKQEMRCIKNYNQYDHQELATALGSTMVADLHRLWPSFKVSTGFTSQFQHGPRFWNHEFYKHGSCLTVDRIEFFTVVMQHLRNLNLNERLLQANIIPSESTTYTASQFGNALGIEENQLIFRCQHDTDRLQDLIICMDVKAINFIQCPVTKREWGCKSSKNPPIMFTM